MGTVSAGKLSEVADVELTCIIGQPSKNVFKCCYGPVQEHLHDLGPYWTGITIDIWEREPSLVALDFKTSRFTPRPYKYSTKREGAWGSYACVRCRRCLTRLVIALDSIYVIQ